VQLSIECSSRHGFVFRLFDPKGKKVAEQRARGGRHFGKNAVSLAAPKDGAAGLMRLTGHAYDSPGQMPLSNLPGEAAVLRAGGEYEIEGTVYYLAPRAGEHRDVFLRFGGPTNYAGQGPTVVRLDDAKGERVIDSSVAGDLQRHTVTRVVDPAQHPFPWKLTVAANVGFRFDGPDRLYLAPDPGRLEAVLKHLSREKP